MNHTKPTELYLGLESGIYSVSEAVEWADEYIAKNNYDDDVANVSLAGNKSAKDLVSLLGNLARHECRIPAMRVVLGRMSIELERNESLAKQIVRYCERFWIAQDYDLPNDMGFMVAADDEFYLANQGIYGTKGEAVSRLKNDLSRFRKYAEPGGHLDACGAAHFER